MDHVIHNLERLDHYWVVECFKAVEERLHKWVQEQDKLLFYRYLF